MKRFRVIAVALVVSLLTFVAACGEDSLSPGDLHDRINPHDVTDDSAREVAVTLNEWSVSPAVAQLEAGKTTFVVTNSGRTVHEFVISEPQAVTDESHRGHEPDAGAAIENIQPGETQRVTVDLEAGEYELACHVVEGSTDHYELGMRSTVNVAN